MGFEVSGFMRLPKFTDLQDRLHKPMFWGLEGFRVVFLYGFRVIG